MEIKRLHTIYVEHFHNKTKQKQYDVNIFNRKEQCKDNITIYLSLAYEAHVQTHRILQQEFCSCLQ